MSAEEKETIDDKFDSAVSETIDESSGEEDLETFIEESFSGQSADTQTEPDFTEDLGYAIEEPEPADDDAGEGDGEEEEIVDEGEEEEIIDDEEEVDTGDGEGEEEEDLADDAEEDDGGDGEEEDVDDDEPYYDAERDYEGEDVPPTVYNDRMSLNHGAVAKASYFNTLKERLNEAGTDIGALSMPEAIGGNPDALKEFTDIEKVISMPDDEAKTFIKQMDVLLKNMKNKAERFEAKQEAHQEEQEVTEAYKTHQTAAQRAVDTLGIEVEKGMTNEEIITKAYDAIDAFEADEDKLDDLGQKEYLKQLRDLEDAAFAIEDFAKIATKHEKMKKSKQQENAEVTREQIETSFKEFMEDQPGLDMVKNKRVEMQKSLIQTALRKGWDVATPRDWLQNYNKFMDIVNANRAKQGLKKLKKGDGDDGGDDSKKKSSKKNGRAKKYAKKKPKINKNVTYTNRTGRKNVDDIDDEIDELASQLTEGGQVGNDEWQF